MLAKPLTKPLYNPLTRLSEGFTTLASLVKQLFANNEEGWWYDPEVAYGWRHNLLTNTDFAGGANGSPGTAPTGWAQFVTGIPTSTFSNNSLSVVVSSTERFQLGQIINVNANTTYVWQVDIDVTIASGIANILSYSAIPAGATASFMIDGVLVAGIATPSVGRHTIAVIISVAATSGACSLRIGGGVQGPGAPYDIVFSAPQFTTLANASKPYQKITDGIQDYYTYANPLPTLYQDSAGTTPVTAMEQTVGLMLDKSKGLVLGPELVTNGGFATDTDWTKGAGWAIGSGVATKTAGSAGALTQTVASTSARWYRVTAAITRTAGTLTVSIGTSGTTASFTASANPTFYILAGSGTQTLSFAGDAAFAGSVDNISVRELPGNHGFQTTLTKRMKVSRRVNLYTNSAFVGGVSGSPGTVPTGLYPFLDANTAVTYGGETVRLETASGSRGQIGCDLAVAANTSYVFKVKANVRASVGALWQHFFISLTPSGSTLKFFIDGVEVAGSAVLPLGVHGLECRATIGATAGTASLRLGNGVQGAPGVFGDIEFTQPTCTLAIDAHLPYQRTVSSTDYDDDPSKFPTLNVLDGIDDSAVTSAGGGGTTGFFFSAAIKVNGGAGANRTLFSDAGTNTGYIVRLNTSNQLELAAGNGTAYTTIATAETLAVGAVDVVQAWDDGTNLNVRIGNGAVASVARPTVSAGTAACSIGQDNGASSGYFNGGFYSKIYRRNSAPTQSQRDSVLTYQRQKAMAA